MNSFNLLLKNKKINQPKEKIKIFCIGDIMLDQNSFNKSNRVSPEGPFPVLEKVNDLFNLGGVGNVFKNLQAYSKNIYLYSVIGSDANGKILRNLLPKSSKYIKLYKEKNRPTTHKQRLFSSSHQILRIDSETNEPISKTSKSSILSSLKKNFRRNDILLISDYNKGLFEEAFCQRLIEYANKTGGKVIIDPKSASFEKYSNSFLVKPNFKEFCIMCDEAFIDENDIEKKAKEQLKKFNIENILVTKGDKGMKLITRRKSFDFCSTAKEVFDVSGAGDTVIACLSYFLSLNYSVKHAIEISNIAAGIVVGKLGAAHVEFFELVKAFEEKNENIYYEKDIEKLDYNLISKTYMKIGFTNGCFDLIHPGHIKLLKESKLECDFLILGVNSDRSVKSNKGNNRPINSELDRAKILKSLKYVDMVIIFDDKTPLNLIKKIKPDILIKGNDYQTDQIAGADFVKSYGGNIKLVSLVKDKSTTNIISKI